MGSLREATATSAHDAAAVSDGLSVTESATPAATVPEPIGIKSRYAVLAVALAAVLVTATIVFRRWDATPSGSADAPRVVVLPLANLSGSEEDFFAEGMTEEIRSKLAGISGLRVIARESAIRYKDRTKSVREIGQELDVDYVLDGAVRTERIADGGGQVRITPQLIRTADESSVWTEAFTADLVPGAMFDAQAQIAARIAESMGVVLLRSERDA